MVITSPNMENEATILTTCPFCKQNQIVNVDAEGYNRWRRGELIQNALPNLSSDIRELLMTGTCSKCWDTVFSD